MTDNSIWHQELFGETYLVSYAKAILWERFNAEREQLTLNQAGGTVSPNILVGKLQDGDPRRKIGEFLPHLTVECPDGVPTVAVQFVDKPPSEWDESFQKTAQEWGEECCLSGVTLVLVRCVGLRIFRQCSPTIVGMP